MKKIIWTMAFLLSLTLFIAGCGTQEVSDSPDETSNPPVNQPNNEQNQSPPAEEPEPKEPIELFMFYPWPADWPEDVFEKMYAEPIQAEFPHITIQYLRGGNISEMITIGQSIDIIWASTGSSARFLLEPELQYDITELINKYDYDLSRFNETILDAGYKFANGELYGLPIYVPPSTMYYNKEIFDLFGVEYPTDDMTWDEIFDLNTRLTRTESDTNYVGIALSYGHMALLNQWSIPMISENTRSTFGTDDRWKPFMESFTRFYENYPDIDFNKLAEPHERRRFFEDRTAGMFFALTALEPEENMIDLDWDVASFPSFADRPGIGPQPYPNFFQVTSMSDYKDDAFQVIAFLASDEYQTRWSKAGSLLTTLDNNEIRETFGSENPFYEGKNVSAFWPKNYAPIERMTEYDNSGNGYFTTAMRKVVAGQTDVNTALREAAEVYDQYIIEKEAAK